MQAMLLIARLLKLSNVYWILEQPESSVLWKHKRLKKLLEAQRAVTISMCMGAFGAHYHIPVVRLAFRP